MKNGEAPWWLRSWVAMWVLTLAPLIFIALAGFGVGRFYELWTESWEGIVAAMGVGMGLKFGKDAAVSFSRNSDEGDHE